MCAVYLAELCAPKKQYALHPRDFSVWGIEMKPYGRRTHLNPGMTIYCSIRVLFSKRLTLEFDYPSKWGTITLFPKRGDVVLWGASPWTTVFTAENKVICASVIWKGRCNPMIYPPHHTPAEIAIRLKYDRCARWFQSVVGGGACSISQSCVKNSNTIVGYTANSHSTYLGIVVELVASLNIPGIHTISNLVDSLKMRDFVVFGGCFCVYIGDVVLCYMGTTGFLYSWQRFGLWECLYSW